MKKAIIKFFDKIIVFLLGFSGAFTGCGNLTDGPVEYGMPHADYELKAMVTDKETSNPIQNIRVIRQYPEYEYKYGDTLYTNAAGECLFNYDGILMPHNTLRLKIEDIDGEDNGGLFETKEMDVQFTKAEQVKKGDGHWYDGKFVITQTIELDKIQTPLYGMPSTFYKP